MNVNKGNTIINVLFGVFLTVKIIKIYSEIKKSRIWLKNKDTKQCNCSDKKR